MTNKATFMMLTTIALALVAFGCGGDSNSGSSEDTTITTSSLSKAEFKKRVKTLCEQRRAALISEVAAYVKERRDEAQGAAILAATKAYVLPSMETQIEEIRSLGAPAGTEKEIESFLLAWQQGVKEVNSTSGSTDIGAVFQPAADLARQNGLGACAYG